MMHKKNLNITLRLHTINDYKTELLVNFINSLFLYVSTLRNAVFACQLLRASHRVATV